MNEELLIQDEQFIVDSCLMHYWLLLLYRCWHYIFMLPKPEHDSDEDEGFLPAKI